MRSLRAAAALAVLAAAGNARAAPADAGARSFAGLGDLLLAVGDGPREALAFALVAAMVVVGLLAVALVIMVARASAAAHSRQRRRVRALEAELCEAKAVLAADPHVLIRWRGAAATEPIVAGRLGPGAGAPDDPERLADPSGWLEHDSAVALEHALRTLRGAGVPFNLFVTARSGARLVAEGFCAAGSVAVKIRELAGSSLAAVIDADHNADLGADAQSLKAALARSPILAWLRDRDRRLVWVNRAYAAAVECDDPDAAVAGRIELVPPEARAEIDASIAKGATATRRLHAVVGGARRAYDIIDTPAPRGSAGIAVDVTDLDRLRDELDRHIAAHARTLDQLATAVAIFGPDEKLNFFNAAYVDLFKLDEAWLRQGPKDGEILDALRDQGRLPEQADYRAWRGKRLAVYTAVEPVEEWWHLPDGQSLRVVIEPHPFGGVTHLYENVTEKFALESKYNALFSVQRETLDNLHEGIALFGSDGRLKLSNPSFASIWKLDGADLANEPHMDDVIKLCRALTGDHEHWSELKSSVSAFGGERRPVAGRIHRPDEVVVDYASVPLPDGATLFTYVDVTDSWGKEQALRERAEALLAADRLKTAFISHVSYELRAPLTSIIGFAEMLGTETFGPLNPKQAEYVGFIQSESGKLHKLINDILDLATIDAGVMELDLGEVDIAGALRATGALLAERIQAEGLELAYDIPDDVGVFVADETRVKQIVYNLLTNAIGFSGPGGRVTVGARKHDAGIEVWVSDRGRGIPPDVREKVFDRFVTHTEGSSHRGTGLGLSVVKSFVELHGGSIAIESEPGSGTTVRLTLPMRAALEAGNGADPASGSSVTRVRAGLSPALPSP